SGHTRPPWSTKRTSGYVDDLYHAHLHYSCTAHGAATRRLFEGSFDMSDSEKPLHIDIPVKLAEVKVVFSIAALAFEGDLPASLFHIQVLENDIAAWKAKSEVIAIFHTNAGHVTLNDVAYNKERNIATGNPSKALIADLVKRGVHIELCGATAK